MHKRLKCNKQHVQLASYMHTVRLFRNKWVHALSISLISRNIERGNKLYRLGVNERRMQISAF